MRSSFHQNCLPRDLARAPRRLDGRLGLSLHERIAPGTRSTYAVLVVPRSANRLSLTPLAARSIGEWYPASVFPRHAGRHDVYAPTPILVPIPTVASGTGSIQ